MGPYYISILLDNYIFLAIKVLNKMTFIRHIITDEYINTKIKNSSTDDDKPTQGYNYSELYFPKSD